MNTLEQLKSHLRPGQVYRRSDLTLWSRSPDRHIAQLKEDKTLIKVSQGLYLCPKNSRFGKLPPNPVNLVTSFLKDDDFLLTSPNDYNSLGLGTTQLYNVRVVYNHKRHGRFDLGGNIFEFRMRPRFPKKATKEYLLVDLVNNIDKLAEDRKQVINQVWKKLSQMDQKRLRSAVKRFGKVSTQKLFREALSHGL